MGAAQLMQTILLVIRPYAVSPLLHMPTDQTFLNDATLAAIPPVLLFFVPSQVRPGQALLTWPVVHERFNFGLLLLIGGSMAINAGFTNSGLDIPLGDALAKVHGTTRVPARSPPCIRSCASQRAASRACDEGCAMLRHHPSRSSMERMRRHAHPFVGARLVFGQFWTDFG